jgi:rhamnosyl/mannosyltransferase
MRVLHFYKTAFPDTMGGTEQVIHQISSGATKLGVKTDVLSLTPDRQARTVEIDGYLAHRARLHLHIASTGFSASAFLRFSQLAKQADVIHYHYPWPFMDLVHFATRVKKPTLVSYHSDIIRQKYLLKLYSPLKNRFFESVDRIVTSSPNYLASSHVLQRYADKVNVIPYGLNKATYPQVEPKKLAFWQDKLGTKFYLFVGVLRYYKGLHILLEAAQGTDYPIAIVGAGPLEQELKAQAVRLGLRNIYFLGRLPDEDKVALLSLCYGFVFPSHLRSESFGISLLEAAMYGKPMISCEMGTGTTFINIADETGLVVPSDDPVELRQAMRYLWDHPVMALTMGKRAEERYWEQFTADQMVRSYVALYGDLVKGYHH